MTIFVSLICAYQRHTPLATKLMKLTNVQRVTVFIWPSSLPMYTTCKLEVRSCRCIVFLDEYVLYYSNHFIFTWVFVDFSVCTSRFFPFVRIFFCRQIGWRCVSHETVSIYWIGFHPSRSSINYHVHFLSIKCK